MPPPAQCKVCSFSIITSQEVRCTSCMEVVHAACTLPYQPPLQSSDNRQQSNARICQRCHVDPGNVTTNTSEISLDGDAPNTLLNISHFNAIMAQLNALSNAVTKCNANFESLNAQLAANTNDIAQLRHENDSLHNKVEVLENRLKNISVTSTIEEAREQTRRERNVMVFGLPTNNSNQQDISHVNNILKNILPDMNITVISGTRVGRNSRVVRPFKAQLQSNEEVIHVLRNKDRICQKNYPNIYIKQDLTPYQLKELLDLRDELQKRKQNGELNLTIKYIHRVPKIVPLVINSVNKRIREEDDSPRRDLGVKVSKSRNPTTADVAVENQ